MIDPELINSLTQASPFTVLAIVTAWGFKLMFDSNARRDEMAERENERRREEHENNMTQWATMKTECHKVHLEAYKTIDKLKESLGDK